MSTSLDSLMDNLMLPRVILLAIGSKFVRKSIMINLWKMSMPDTRGSTGMMGDSGGVGIPDGPFLTPSRICFGSGLSFMPRKWV